MAKYPPAECPETKIREASPPNVFMFLKTQAVAAAASSIYFGATTFGAALTCVLGAGLAAGLAAGYPHI